MLSKFVTVGARIEMRAVRHSVDDEVYEEARKRVYFSQIHDIMSEDTMEVVMPMEKTKLILLPIDKEFELVIYGESGLYQCYARITDRYKSNNMYLLAMELTSSLSKYQRREYYRFSCALDMRSRELLKEERRAVENQLPYTITPGLPMTRSVIVDISGGGLRFVSEQQYEPDSLIYISYFLKMNRTLHLYEMVGKVLSAKEIENRQGNFEHRVQYYDMNRQTREAIIKYIFEEERKNRRKERLE